VTFAPLPATACWRHRGARSGFEVAYFEAGPDGWRMDGTTAAYVRALDLSAGRLEQSYARLPDEDGRQRYRYAAPAFGFTATLIYDQSGLVLDYPGIAVRAR
jgi:Putative glycolipid-binding